MGFIRSLISWVIFLAFIGIGAVLFIRHQFDEDFMRLAIFERDQDNEEEEEQYQQETLICTLNTDEDGIVSRSTTTITHYGDIIKIITENGTLEFEDEELAQSFYEMMSEALREIFEELNIEFNLSINENVIEMSSKMDFSELDENEVQRIFEELTEIDYVEAENFFVDGQPSLARYRELHLVNFNC